MKKFTWLVPITLLIANFVIFCFLCYTFYEINFSINWLQNKLMIYEMQRYRDIISLRKVIQDSIKETSMIDKRILCIITEITNTIETIKQRQLVAEEELTKLKILEIPKERTIKRANVTLVNKDLRIATSGTVIKIRGEKYILTCAHILKSDKDEIWVLFDNRSRSQVKLVKLSHSRDLALFKTFSIDKTPYMEISKEVPPTGSHVLVVGNPDGLTDVITSGVIAKTMEKKYLLTNIVYKGSSGGAVLYKGKIVGVISQLKVLFEPPILVNYGISSNLVAIQEFLQGI